MMYCRIYLNSDFTCQWRRFGVFEGKEMHRPLKTDVYVKVKFW